MTMNEEIDWLLGRIQKVADRLDDAGQCTALRLNKEQRAECVVLCHELEVSVHGLRECARYRGFGEQQPESWGLAYLATYPEVQHA